MWKYIMVTNDPLLIVRWLKINILKVTGAVYSVIIDADVLKVD